MDWYALFVSTGKEEYVQKWLDFHYDKSSLYSIVPKRKLIGKKDGKTIHLLKTMFPGYVFIKTQMDFDKYFVLKSIPKIIKILGNSYYYSIIDNDEMSLILKLIGETDIVDISKVFIQNSKVYVKDGPIYGMEGTIKRIDKHKNRARIELSFMGESRLVDVGVEILYAMD